MIDNQIHQAFYILIQGETLIDKLDDVTIHCIKIMRIFCNLFPDSFDHLAVINLTDHFPMLKIQFIHSLVYAYVFTF